MIRTSVAVLSLGLMMVACSPAPTESASEPAATQPGIDPADVTVPEDAPATPIPGLIDRNGIETQG